MHSMHCTVFTSEEVAHAVSRCFITEMQGRFANGTDITGQLEGWAEITSKCLRAQFHCNCVVAQGIISGHKGAAATLVQLAGAL